MLRSAVTGDELDLVDVSTRPLVLEAGDYVILASDGLHTLEHRVQRIVSAYADDGAGGCQCAHPRRRGHRTRTRTTRRCSPSARWWWPADTATPF